MKKLENKHSTMQTNVTFKALVDAVIPRTTGCVEKRADIQSLGALDVNTDEYHIWSLESALSVNVLKMNFKINLAKPTAKMLNIAAKLLIDTIGNNDPVDSDKLSDGCEFAALAPGDRFRALLLLEQLKVKPSSLPLPFWNNPGLVLHIVTSLNFFNTFLYYSGWTELSSAKIDINNQNKVDYSPLSWKQIGYPGPSKGYHALRGYIDENFMK